MKAISEQQAYWTERLSRRSVEGVTLPMDRERPPAASFIRETVSIPIPHGLYTCLQQCARDRAVSLEVVLLAGFYAGLYRQTGSTDIAIGLLIDAPETGQGNLVVLRTEVSRDQNAQDVIRGLAISMEEAASNSGCSFVSVREALAPDGPLFHLAFRFSNSSLYADELAACDVVFEVRENGSEFVVEAEYDAELYDAPTIESFLRRCTVLLEEMAADQSLPVSRLGFLTSDDRRTLLLDWNNTEVEFDGNALIHELFETQARRTPEKAALVFEDRQVTYRELNARSNRLAHHLRTLGAGPGELVGICVERSLEMVAGLLGILKAGAAYVPLDPNYPGERLAFMFEDADVRVLLTQQRLIENLPKHAAHIVCLDCADSEFLNAPEDNPTRSNSADDLAYVIYTSGSTGKPKGVMISHRNVVNFFTGMDGSIGFEPGVWLAVTSISFDISVLELFWTLCRGFTVVVSKDESRRPVIQSGYGSRKKKIGFSLLYFASDEGQDAGSRYRLLLEGAKFADEHGFEAVWTPERHFHRFGGLYPNPSVTSAAVAAVTRQIKIRAGSVVIPLHNPIRVAEEWSVVDNLSNGRVAVSFASGWQTNDFVLAPHNYGNRKEVMLQSIETVQRLWRGETLQVSGVDGKPAPVKLLPRPVQSELPVWLTATGNPETFRSAGQLGAGILTHLVGQKVEDLADKITIYRNAWREYGHAGEGHVTLMLHTFVGEGLEAVRQIVREPFTNYLKTSVDLLKSSPWAFAPARLSADAQVKQRAGAPADLNDAELSVLLEHAFDGYFEHNSLFGTPDVCLQMVERLRAIGVDEIACLIDFGIDSQTVLDNLTFLDEVRERANVEATETVPDHSLASLARQHGVTHFQCTPSMAGMLMSQPENREWIEKLRSLMIGGEAFPVALAKQLQDCAGGAVHNMYGPTETTVWSTTNRLGAVDEAVSIGRPIANTQIYILDETFQLVPPGAAGEICIGGAGVARGYLNRPELTAEKFIRNPFTNDPENCLYRTGDLARYRSNGTIEFLGRLDHQVKIRGHRIEPGEIEAVLGRHTFVREAAVIAREDAEGGKRLVAYVALRRSAAGAMQDSKQLRHYLASRLPEYMMPSAFVFMDRLPQTPNGKIDRRALPAPERATSIPTDEFIAPRTPVEEILAATWAELLGVDRIGVEDNFFELGGHSLLATQLVTRLRGIFHIDLPLSVLFEAPTVAGLAAFMIAREPKPGLFEKTAGILKRINSMSEGEVRDKLKARQAG
jgi:natural product biosynthesis luciferase-like monooxygenase protein